MVRISADLIAYSPQYTNPIGERELSLRGNKIAVIENLGGTENQFECIDFSDNEIVKLEGFPLLKRLRSLIVANNRISRISDRLGVFLPSLETLVLANNRFVNLADLDALSSLKSLQRLSLLDNVVCKKPNYRLYVLHRVPSLRLLDFKKVKQKEREEAEKLFGGEDSEAKLRAAASKQQTFVPGEGVPEAEAATAAAGAPAVVEPAAPPKPTAPTPEQLTAIKAAIANAQTLDEVARLEKALKSGQMPTDIMIDTEMADGHQPMAAEVPREQGLTNGGNASADHMQEG
eukprot:jgi/Chlat1/3061/Chrsp21S03382